MILLAALALLGTCLAGLAAWRCLSPSRLAALVPQAQPTESLKTMAVANLRRYVRTRTLVDRQGRRRLRIVVMGPPGAGKSSLLNTFVNALVDTVVQPIVRLLWNSHQARGVQGNRFNQEVPHCAEGIELIDTVGAPGGDASTTAAYIISVVVDPSRQPSVPNRHTNAARLTRSPTSQPADCVWLILRADKLPEEKDFWATVIACLHDEYNFDAVLVHVTSTDRYLERFGREFGDADARQAANDLGVNSDRLTYGTSYVESDTERQDERERPALRMLAQTFAVVEATSSIVPPPTSLRLVRGVISSGAELMNKPRDTQIAIAAVTAFIAYVVATMLFPKQSIMAGYKYTA